MVVAHFEHVGVLLHLLLVLFTERSLLANQDLQLNHKLLEDLLVLKFVRFFLVQLVAELLIEPLGFPKQPLEVFVGRTLRQEILVLLKVGLIPGKRDCVIGQLLF